MEKLIIRNENKKDYAAVENMIRNAFWNVHVPGVKSIICSCDADHEDFIPELVWLAELEGKVVGNVMYTESKSDRRVRK